MDFPADLIILIPTALSSKQRKKDFPLLNKKITEIFKKVEDLEEVTKENKSEIGALKEGQQNLDKKIENVKQSNLESSVNS